MVHLDRLERSGSTTAARRVRRLAATVALAVLSVLGAMLSGRPAQAVVYACLPSDLQLTTAPPASIQLAPRAALAGPATKAPLTASSFQLVLAFDMLPARVLLNTDDRSQLPIEILPATPPAGVTVNQSAGTITLFLPATGPWYAQVCYTGDGMPVTQYVVLTPPFSITSGTPRTVPIQRALAVNTLNFKPVDFKGRPIAPAPKDLDSLLVFSFIHRKTGNFTYGFDAGFGGKILMVSNVTPDYSFGAIGAAGRKFGLPLHLYTYSLRRGITGSVLFGNTASQLVHRQLVGSPEMAASPVYFLTWIGFVNYAPPANAGIQGGLMNDFATATAPAGQGADLYNFQSSDTSLDLAAPGNATMPDFPAFTFLLASMDTVPGSGALPDTLFTSPTFAGDADPARAFLSVDTLRGVFDHPALLVPPATVSIGATPLFDTSFLTRSCADGSIQLRARRLAASGYVPYLTADFSNQANRQVFLAGATSTLTVRGGASFTFKALISPAGPDLTGVLTTFKAPAGSYHATLVNPGPQIAGTPFPVRTKTFFTVGPAVDGSPPALTKAQLLVGGQTANAINPAASNVLSLGIDPVAGVNASCATLPDSLQKPVLKVSLDGAPFAPVPLALVNGDWQAVLPAAGAANRFDFKVSAADLAGNRLVSRFSLGVAGRDAGAAPALDTALVVSPTALSFQLSPGTTGNQVLSLASADEPIGFTVSANVPWLSFGQTSGVTPVGVTVSARSAGLAVGTYQGKVTIAPDDPAVAAPVTVPVTLTVTATTGL